MWLRRWQAAAGLRPLHHIRESKRPSGRSQSFRGHKSWHCPDPTNRANGHLNDRQTVGLPHAHAVRGPGLQSEYGGCFETTPRGAGCAAFSSAQNDPRRSGMRKFRAGDFSRYALGLMCGAHARSRNCRYIDATKSLYGKRHRHVNTLSVTKICTGQRARAETACLNLQK